MTRCFFPHGFGTRAWIATLITVAAVGAAWDHGKIVELLALATMVVAFYFKDRAINDANSNGSS